MKNDNLEDLMNSIAYLGATEEEKFWIIERQLIRMAESIAESEDQIDLWECRISEIEDEVAGLEKEKLAIWADPEYKRLKRLALRFPCEGQISLLS